MDELPDQVDQLPTAYAVALRLRHAGASDADIGAALGLPTDAVPTLVELARAKLADLVE